MCVLRERRNGIREEEGRKEVVIKEKRERKSPRRKTVGPASDVN